MSERTKPIREAAFFAAALSPFIRCVSYSKREGVNSGSQRGWSRMNFRGDKRISSHCLNAIEASVVAGQTQCAMASTVYVRVDNVEPWCDFVEKVAEGHQDRMCPWVFRGQADVAWAVQNSFDRLLNRVEFYPPDYRVCDMERELRCEENEIFEKFQSQAQDLPNSIRPCFETKLGWYALMQHYGVPTRLIDFTRNPFIALYFAVEKGDTDYSIWMINSFSVANRQSHVCESNNEYVCQDWDTLMRENRLIAEDVWTCNSAYIEQVTAIVDRKALFVELDSKESNERIKAQEGLFMMPTLLSFPSASLFDGTLCISFRDRLRDFNKKTGADYKEVGFDEFKTNWVLFRERNCIVFRFTNKTRKEAIRNGLFKRGICPKVLFPACNYAFELEQIARTLALEYRAKDIPPLSPFSY